VYKSLIKNVNSLSLLGKRAKNWLDTSEPPITTDNNDKIKMYVYSLQMGINSFEISYPITHKIKMAI
jgi:hypothetical protein